MDTRSVYLPHNPTMHEGALRDEAYTLQTIPMGRLSCNNGYTKYAVGGLDWGLPFNGYPEKKSNIRKNKINPS